MKDYALAAIGGAIIVGAASVVALAENSGALAVYAILAAMCALVLLFREV
jgi:hypothetical protein